MQCLTRSKSMCIFYKLVYDQARADIKKAPRNGAFECDKISFSIPRAIARN